jgi:prevent-host-death family protein
VSVPIARRDVSATDHLPARPQALCLSHVQLIIWSLFIDHICYNVSMKTISAAAFKAQCLTLMDDVCATKRPLLITKRGKPVARLMPVAEDKDDFIGRLKGVFEVVGDLDEDAPEPWESAL